jgi:pimeloyl-ACP methyl ester carboxylesterase
VIQPLFEHRMTFAGYGTRVLELEGDGVPLVLIHGYADSADTWRQVLHRLSRSGRRAVAVDLPGFADAEPLQPGAVLPQLDAFAAEVLAYAADHRRTPVVAVGNSLGGCLALRAAERHPERLAGLVAVAPAGLQMNPLLGIVERDPLLRSLLALPAPVPAGVLRAAVARIYRVIAFASPGSADAALVASFTQHHRSRAAVARYLDIAHRLIPELRSPFQLARIRCPVLVVWGDTDRLLYHRGAQQIIDGVDGARLELLPGVGHCPQVEAPERLTELVLDFAAGLGVAPAAR